MALPSFLAQQLVSGYLGLFETTSDDYLETSTTTLTRSSPIAITHPLARNI